MNTTHSKKSICKHAASDHYKGRFCHTEISNFEKNNWFEQIWYDKIGDVH